MKKIISFILLLIAIVAIIIGCNYTNKETKKEIQAVKMLSNSIEIEKGEKFNIYDIINKGHPALFFESENASVASVNNEGMIIARNVGITYITITDENGKVKKVKITIASEVEKETPTIKIKNCPQNITVNNNYDLELDISNLDDKDSFEIKSSNEDIIKVINNKQIYAKKIGATEIIVYYNKEKVDTCKIQVNESKEAKSDTDTKVKNTTSNRNSRPAKNGGVENSHQPNTTTPITHINKIRLSSKRLELAIGQSSKIGVDITPSNATNKTIIWKSSNPDIVSIDSNGILTSKTEGTVTITAQSVDGGHTDFCDIYVYRPIVEAKGIEINKKSISVLRGESLQLEAKISPENTTNKKIRWSSSDEGIATVSETGQVSTISEGEAVITAETENGKKDTSKIYVINPVITPPDIEAEKKIELDKKEYTIDVNKVVYLQATITPEEYKNDSIKWISENETVATVDQYGKVTGKSEGIVKITAISENASTSCVITVKAGAPNNLIITPQNINILIGNTENIKVHDENGVDVTSLVSLKIADETIASLTGKETILGKNIGTTTITATKDNISVDAKITVEEIPPQSISLSNSKVAIEMGKTHKLIATIAPTNTTNKTVRWTSNNPNVATVDQNGLVTGRSLGTTIITATTSNGKTVSCEVSVHAPVVTAESVTLNKTSLSILSGTNTQLTATITPANTTDKTVKWTSSNPNIATVDNAGLVTGKVSGTATITATTSNGKTASCSVKVTQLVNSINITTSNTALNIKKTQTQLSATISPSTATNKSITWKSSNPNVATVDSSGKVTRKKEGTAIITATANDGSNVVGSKTITVQKEVVIFVGASTTRQLAGLRSTGSNQDTAETVNSNFKTANIRYDHNYGYTIYASDSIYEKYYGPNSPYNQYYIKTYADNMVAADLFFIAQSGKGLSYLQNTAENEVVKIIDKNPNAHFSISILLGGNDIASSLGKNEEVTKKMVENVADKYYNEYKEFYNTISTKANLYIISLTPKQNENGIITKYNKVKDDTSYRRTIFSARMKNRIQNGTISGIKYIDINGLCNNDADANIPASSFHYSTRCTSTKNKFSYVSGGHYNKETAQKVFYYIMDGMKVLDNSTGMKK